MITFQIIVLRIFQKVRQSLQRLSQTLGQLLEKEKVKPCANAVIAEDEGTTYAKAFQTCLTELANEVYGNTDPFDISQRVLRATCDFYDADWCGMFDADMMLDLWMPFWWFNRKTGGMTETQLQQGSVMGSFERFRQMIENNTAVYQSNIENIRETHPEEYSLFVSQDVKSFMAVPYSRRERGIIFLRNPKRFSGRQEMLRISSNILIQEINEQKHLDRLKLNAASADLRKDADVLVNLFGGIEVMTEQGKLVEAEMNSAVCSKLFVFLMLNRQRAIPASVLCETIWADKEYENPISNLRSTLYRLRNMFDLLFEGDIIVTSKNGYRINPDIKIHADFEHFEKLCNSMTPFMPKESKINILKEAVEIYDGKLFPSGDGELWLISYTTHYRMMYHKAVQELMKLLNEVGDYQTMQEYSMMAVQVEPDNMKFIYWLVVALRENGAVDRVKQHLDSAKARLLEEEYRELERMLGIAS